MTVGHFRLKFVYFSKH